MSPGEYNVWNCQSRETKELCETRAFETARTQSEHFYYHLVVKNGYFICLLTFYGQEWQLYIATDM